MEISHKFIEQKMCSEHQLFYDQHKMFKEILERGRVGVEVNRNTKTSLRVSIYMGLGRFSMNFYDERFKFLKNEDYSHFSNRTSTRYHFKMSKHQGLQELIEYVEIAFRAMCNKYESEGVTLPKVLTMMWEETSPIRELQIKQH
jgi:hypothetical protein